MSPERITYIRLDSAQSTNTELTGRAATLPHGSVVVCRRQTAGRGQRGNSWEAEPGLNLTFSILLRPRVIPPAGSFRLSMLVAIAIARSLQQAIGPEHQVEVKWPNDIYVGDRKLGGILIENSFCGNRIDYSIAGIGINVNQTRFVSDAPNPVSMAMLTHREFNLDELLDRVVSEILDTVGAYEESPDDPALGTAYHSMLWRRNGTHRWHDELAGCDIEAPIRGVAMSGHLTLDCEPPRTYAFKEISAIL